MLAASPFANRWRGWQALRSLAPALLKLAGLAGTGKRTSCAASAGRPPPAPLSLRVHQGVLHPIREKPQASALRASERHSILKHHAFALKETPLNCKEAPARRLPGSICAKSCLAIQETRLPLWIFIDFWADFGIGGAILCAIYACLKRRVEKKGFSFSPWFLQKQNTTQCSVTLNRVNILRHKSGFVNHASVTLE